MFTVSTLGTNKNPVDLSPEADLFKIFQAKDPVRYESNPVLLNNGTYTNICPGGIVTDPLDSSKFLFYLAEFLGAITVGARISVFVGDKSNPYALGASQGVVLEGTPGTDDENGCRWGSFLTVDGVVHAYYTGVSSDYKWRIFHATSNDGRTFTKQGMVMDFNDVDEKSLSGAGVHYNSATGEWAMCYTAWNGIGSFPNNNPGESKLGIKSATSSDGITWTKTNTYVLPLGVNGSYDDTNVEDGQLLKFGDMWVILYSCRGTARVNPAQKDWTCCMGYGLDITKQFIKNVNPWFPQGESGEWDTNLVACPLLFDFGAAGEVMYYQGSNVDPEAIDVGAALMV